ncbi:hypothetical protein C9980_18925 [Vibrio mediterranei]|nr:hypothetical protein C9980_18925 [Vibrio mediterranei]
MCEFDALKTTFEFQRLEGIRVDWYGQVEPRLVPLTPYIAHRQLYQENECSNSKADVDVKYDLLSNLSVNVEYQ